MRIPSNLRDETLYRRNPGRPGPDGAFRRLTRLIIALVLIVVVMHQAGRQEIYEPFFGDPNTTATAPPSAPDASPPSSTDVAPRRTAVDRTAEDRTGSNAEVVEALRKVVDGSPWRGGDFAAFYLFLDKAQREDQTQREDQAQEADRPSHRQPSPLAGVLPLLQQPELYQGRRLRVRGAVARVQFREAAENDHGIDTYWELWLRPYDGTDRPLLAIVPDIPPTLKELAGPTDISDGPRLTVDGRFLKRLAYRSSAGVELTPVVIGRLTRPAATGTTPAETPHPATSDWPLGATSVALLAIVIGIAIAALATWRTSRDAARARQLRRAELERSDDWLQQLAETDEANRSDQDETQR